MSIHQEWLKFLRDQYPVGSRIKLREMGSDDPCPIRPGSMGSLQYIDDLGTFHVAWDDGCGLGLVIGQDSFSVSPPPLQTLKLYMPMTATYYDEDDPEQDITMDSREAAQYAPPDHQRPAKRTPVAGEQGPGGGGARPDGLL